MRIWSIHPKYLDWMGLGAQWREGLLAQKVLQGETKGWRHHPQLNRFKEHPEPLNAAGYYLNKVCDEARRRGYNYDRSKILFPVESVSSIDLNWGQIVYEFEILQERLIKRAPEKYRENLLVEQIEPHSLFKLRAGLPEPWEKSYWNKIS